MNTLLLFDVDGTLTQPMLPIDQEFKQKLLDLRAKYDIGVIGGSNLEKIIYQLGLNIIEELDYVFAENGLIAYHKGKLIGITRLDQVLDQNEIDKIKQFVHDYIKDLDIPVKRSKFIEIRSGMFNISPIGRDCSYDERVEFQIYDNQHKIRETMIDAMKTEFSYLNLEYVIGGMISFDVYPKGWDKSFCMKYIKHYDDIVFFGDKTEPGGNDHTLYKHSKVMGISVCNWRDTENMLDSLK